MIKYKQTSYETVFSPDETRMINIGGSVSLFDMNHDKPTLMFTNNALTNPSYAAFSPDMGLIAAVSTSGKLALLDGDTGETIVKNKGVGSEGWGIFFIDDKRVLTSGWNGKIGVWDIITNKLEVLFQFCDAGLRIFRIEGKSRFVCFGKIESDYEKLAPSNKAITYQIALLDFETEPIMQVLLEGSGSIFQDFFTPKFCNPNNTKFYSFLGKPRLGGKEKYMYYDLASNAIKEEEYTIKNWPFNEVDRVDWKKNLWHVDDVGILRYLKPETLEVFRIDLGWVSCDSAKIYHNNKVVLGDGKYIYFANTGELYSFRKESETIKAKMPPKKLR